MLERSAFLLLVQNMLQLDVLMLSFSRVNKLFIRPLFLLKNVFILDQLSHLVPMATDCQQSFCKTVFAGMVYRKQNLRA